ncbi:hypothetical protein BDF20DRAFT_234587 [Mycotypha africana]|uniref:uncharacterized protein n=1 Tax=Mycotypha africana TaxID=64632 RepID=UPI002301D4C5|nr:uncharacterized protein BDF20DRAFT_234587 [Mycotypha africana]KAI8967430.1 hypothetical protein BDF20DRAFT_234587 [Mycotypha africana]
MPKRQRLFRNKVFWFFDEHQFKLYQLLVRVGGGSAKYATFEEAMNASLDNNQLFVEPPKLIEAFRPVKARYHQELDVTRCILQNEIDYAIIYCSTNILCNPDADPSEEVDNLIENATLESPESVIKREADDDIATVPYTHYNDEAPTVRAAYNEDDPTVPYEHDDTMVPIKEEKSDDYPLFDAEIIQSNEKDGLDDERKDGDLHNNVRDKLPLAERNGYRSNHSDTDTAEDEQQEGTDNNEDSPAKSGSRPIERTQDEDEELFEKTHNDDKQLIDGAADNDINSSHRIGADESAYDNDISMDEAEIDPTPQMPDDLMDMDSFFDNMFAKTNSQIEQKKKEKQRQQELKRKQQEERQRRESSERKQQEEMQRLVDEEIKRYEQEKQEQAAEYARQQQQREQDVIRDDDRNSRQRVEAELPKESVDSTMRDTEISESNENCNEQANSTQNENREQNNDAIGDRQCCIIFAPLVVNRRPPNIAAPAEAYEEGNTAINYKRFKKVKHLQEYANTIYSWTDTVTNSQLQRNRLTGIGQPRFGETRLTATEIDDDMVIRPTTNRNRRLRNM